MSTIKSYSVGQVIARIALGFVAPVVFVGWATWGEYFALGVGATVLLQLVSMILENWHTNIFHASSSGVAGLAIFSMLFHGIGLFGLLPAMAYVALYWLAIWALNKSA